MPPRNKLQLNFFITLINISRVLNALIWYSLRL